MTGWETPDFTECLLSEPKGEISGMEKFLEEYPLAALSADKKYFAVIRDFSYHVTDGRIKLLNAKGEGERSHKGMTMVTATNNGGNFSNVIMPNDLDYKQIHLDGRQLHIHFGGDKKTTNFQEIYRRLSLDEKGNLVNLTEDEIVKAFYSLEDKFEEKIEIERQTIELIKTDFFGMLKLDRTYSYVGNFVYNGASIRISFENIDKGNFDKNLASTERMLTKINELQNSMIDKMLEFKNGEWLESTGSVLSKNDFLGYIKLYGINVYEYGSLELFYKDGGLFSGHDIVIDADPDGNFVGANIMG